MQRASDRSDVVQKATQLVNRGDLNGAVRIYARLFQEDSRDWSVGNTLGDLYVRLGKADDAISHFTVLAEQLAADGFAAKSRALYRKILRIEPRNVLARQRVDELERQQAGQTSPFLQRVLETARTLRETESAAPPARGLNPGDGSPALQPDETPREPASPEATPRNAARPDSAPSVAVIASSASPQAALPPPPGSARLPQTDAEWAEEWAAALSAPTASATHTDSMSRPAASSPTTTGSEPPPNPPAPPAAPAIAVAEPPPPAAEPVTMDAADEFRMMEAEAHTAAAQHDFRAAVAIVEDFLAARPYHIAALEKLIELGVDGALGTQLVVAQVRLAEACLRAERFSQAYYIVLDLIARHPESPSHRTLLDRVRAVAREHGRTFPAPPVVDAEVTPPPVAEAKAPAAPVSIRERPGGRILRPDFTEGQAGRSKPESATAEKLDAAPAPSGALADLLKDLGDPEHAFEEIRNGLLEEAAAAAEERFAEATRHIEARRFEEAVRALEEAMCAPHLRAPAGTRLARICREQGAAMEALTCLEWVAEIPPSSEDGGHELAYELALTLEALGQHAQALGLYRELLAEVGPGYRDVEERAQRLAAA